MKRLAALIALAVVASCQQPTGDGLRISGATYRPPLGSSGVGVAYLTIRSDKDDRVVGVSSAMAKSVEIHANVTMPMSGPGMSVDMPGMTSMKKLDSVALPAGKDVVFSEGGMHLMVFDPQPIKAGDATFPVEFKLESGTTKIVPFRSGTGGN